MIFKKSLKLEVKLIEIYEGVIYRESFWMNPSEKVIDKLFALRLKYEEEAYEVMQLLIKLIMNALDAELLWKDILECYQCKWEMWMTTEYDERVLDYQKIIHGNYMDKMKDDEGLQDEIKKVNTLPLQLIVFILPNSKRIMNNFLHAIDGFYTNDNYYTDTDSLYIENKHWDKIDKIRLVGKNLLQGRNDYKDGGIFYGLFLAPKRKHCLIITKYGILNEKKSFKGFTNLSDNLDRKIYLKMAGGDNLIAKVPLSWKKSFSQGVVITHKMRNCTECKKDVLCESCDNLVDQKK